MRVSDGESIRALLPQGFSSGINLKASAGGVYALIYLRFYDFSNSSRDPSQRLR
jgi:hypothetical protein